MKNKITDFKSGLPFLITLKEPAYLLPGENVTGLPGLVTIIAYPLFEDSGFLFLSSTLTNTRRGQIKYQAVAPKLSYGIPQQAIVNLKKLKRTKKITNIGELSMPVAYFSKTSQSIGSPIDSTLVLAGKINSSKDLIAVSTYWRGSTVVDQLVVPKKIIKNITYLK